MPSKNEKYQEYTASQIQSLTPREHIRRRPGMYIGGIDKRALHNLMDIPLDYAIERVLNGNASKITINLMKDRTVQISVDDTEISAKMIDVWKITGLEADMTRIGTGYQSPDGYIGVAGGLHGIGLSALTPLSSNCTVEIKCDGFVWQQSYVEGLVSTETERIREMSENESRSTKFTFTPDFTIFEDNDFDFEIITVRCRDLAYLSSKLTITVRDTRIVKKEETYHFPNGLADWVKQQSQGNKVLHDVISVKHIHQLTNRWGTFDIGVNLAFQYVDADNRSEKSFVNTIKASDGGTHLEGLQKAIIEHVWENDIDKADWDIVGRGFISIVSIFHPDPQFESQTKVKLLNPEVEDAVAETVKIAFAQNPEALAIIREHISGA